MPCILSRRFRHIGAREWVLQSAVYEPHIPREGSFPPKFRKALNYERGNPLDPLMVKTKCFENV